MRVAVRWLAIATILVAVFGSAGACDSPSGPCCVVCRTGKACGNSCIARTDTCRVGSGCACNG